MLLCSENQVKLCQRRGYRPIPLPMAIRLRVKPAGAGMGENARGRQYPSLILFLNAHLQQGQVCRKFEKDRPGIGNAGGHALKVRRRMLKTVAKECRGSLRLLQCRTLESASHFDLQNFSPHPRDTNAPEQ